MRMRVTKDEEYDLLYVGFKDHTEAGEVATTREFLPGAYLDLDAEGNLLGIEIVNTKAVLGFPAAELRLPGETTGSSERWERGKSDKRA
jgi:uncharacterized protein YuzE